MPNTIKVFTGNASPQLARAIADRLDLEMGFRCAPILTDTTARTAAGGLWDNERHLRLHLSAAGAILALDDERVLPRRR